MDKNTLYKVGEWAQSRVASGEEPPWTYHKLKLFAEIANDLAGGMEVVATYPENSEREDVSTLGQNTDTPTSKVIQMDDFRSFRQNNEELQLPS